MAEEQYVPISPTVPAEEILKFRQPTIQQPEGSGLRVGNKAEFTLLAPVTSGGAALFRQRTAKLQTEAAYWEGHVGTVHDIRVALVNEDKHVLFAATYSQEFEPYLQDVIRFATPWIDYMFVGVVEGFPGLTHPEAIPYITKYQVESSVWYASNENASVRDTTKALKLLNTFEELLDIAQG